MRLTEEMLERGKSINGGWSTRQIRCLGDDMTRRGWKDRLIGKPISPNTLHEFLSLKNLHLKKKHLKQMPSKTLSKEYIMAWIEENTCNVKGRKYIDLDDFEDLLLQL